MCEIQKREPSLIVNGHYSAARYEAHLQCMRVEYELRMFKQDLEKEKAEQERNGTKS